MLVYPSVIPSVGGGNIGEVCPNEGGSILPTVPCLELLEHEIIKANRVFISFIIVFKFSPLTHTHKSTVCCSERVAPIASLLGEPRLRWSLTVRLRVMLSPQHRAVWTQPDCQIITAANQPLVCWLTKTQPGSLPGQTQWIQPSFNSQDDSQWVKP